MGKSASRRSGPAASRQSFPACAQTEWVRAVAASHDGARRGLIGYLSVMNSTVNPILNNPVGSSFDSPFHETI